MNASRYKLPGPEKSFYIVSLMPACVDCDAPPGITIEQYKAGGTLHKYYSDRDNHNGPLRLAKWPDSLGVAITCGHTLDEFKRAVSQHLIDLDVPGMVNDSGRFDDIGADIVAEDMYEDAVPGPSVVPDARKKGQA